MFILYYTTHMSKILNQRLIIYQRCYFYNVLGFIPFFLTMINIQMKKILLLLLVFSVNTILTAQDNFNLELLSQVPFEESGNDIWGYTDDEGIEYAICGSRTNTRIYSLEDPTNPEELLLIPGESSTWRDMKSWDKHVYVTTDVGQDGLLIINMENAPNDITYKFWQPFIDFNGIQGQLGSCHNIYIDEFGTVYLSGCGGVGNAGVIMLNIDDRENPVVVGIENETYSHDAYAKNNILYSSDILDGDFTIFDVSDKANPINLGDQVTTTVFTHNAWLSDDEQYLFTTDERPGAFVDAYDVSDPSNIIYLDSYQPEEKQDTEVVIPHNTHYYNGYLVTSWYTQGVIIIDAHRPDNLVRVGQYDTYESANCDSGFCGNWGAYPFFESETILVNDINSGLYVFKPTYVRACYLEGTITDETNGSAINMANVELIGPKSVTESTEASGEYKMGQVEPGTFDVLISHPLYESKTVSASLVNGEVTILDVALTPLEMVVFSGTIKDTEGNPVPNGVISVIGEAFNFETLGDDDGNFTLSVIPGDYIVYGGAWGYHQIELMYSATEDSSADLVVQKGYRDDYILELGWTINTNAETGEWVRVNPIQATFGGTVTVPEDDVADDVGDMCYVTGNGSPNSPDDDIDDGSTSLTSDLMDLSTYEDPVLTFEYFFQNGGGTGTPNDQLEVIVRNGNGNATALVIEDNVSNWTKTPEIHLADYIEITDQMSIRFIGSDDNPGHVIDISLDKFHVYDAAIPSTNKNIVEDASVIVSPNPFNEVFNITSKDQKITNIKIYNSVGQIILNKNYNDYSIDVNLENRLNGLYYIELQNERNQQFIKRVIKY